jgi:3-hydroxyisobutyrate dehydrogenase-like beta-hydroxyacid dehydrogenase
LNDLGIHKATLAPSVQAAVQKCDVVCTMLANDEATESVAFGAEGFLAALPSRAVHIALGTLSVGLSRRLMESHAAADQRYIAAPVFGRPNVALQGRLWVVAAGDDATLEHVRTVLDAIGRGVTIVGNEAPQAHAFKLGGNFMISAMVQTISEAFVFATAEGLNPELFLETVNEALFQSPFYSNYGRVMLHPPEHPGATVLLGEKDIRLFREATQSAGVRLGLAEYLQDQFNAAIGNGLGNTDWAVGQYRMAEQASKNKSSQEMHAFDIAHNND